MALDAAVEGDPLALTQAISVLSLERLEDDRQIVEELVKEREALRASWKWANKNNPSYCAEIETKGKAINVQLDQYTSQATLSSYKRQDRRDEAVDTVMLIICWFNDQLNVPALDETQIKSAAFMIIDLHGPLRIEDVAICFRNAIKGKYGAIYGKLDGTDLLKYLDKHYEKLKMLRKYGQVDRHINTKGNPNAVRRGQIDRNKMHEAKLYNHTEQLKRKK